MSNSGQEAGGMLLDALVGFLQRFVVLSDAQAVAIALWIVHTHAFLAAAATPYLSITSAEKRSGKTRLLEVLELLVARPWLVGRITLAVLARKTDAECPTLLLDESDAALKSDREYAEGLRGLLNAGYRSGGKTTVCTGKGSEINYKDLSCFCPKAIAGLGRLPDTVEDRAVRIELKRRLATETVERFRRRDVSEEAGELHSHLEQWSATFLEALEDARPDLPPELDDRASDCWEPLLAIADLVGGDWPLLARTAAVELSGSKETDDDSFGVQLLSDIRRVFTEERISTAGLLERLRELDEAPWADWYGKPLPPRTLAKFLKPYGIRSKSVRLPDGGNLKGYERAQFTDVWTRYIPSPADFAVTSVTSAPQSQNGAVPVPSQTQLVTDSETPENPHRNGDVTLVTGNGSGKRDRCSHCGGALTEDEDGDPECVICGRSPRAARVVG